MCHDLYQRKLVSGKGGNISCKYNDSDDTYVIITESGISFKDMTNKNVLITDTSGEVLSGYRKPSSELGMHLAIYKKRPDINSIIHTHSPYASGYAFSDRKLKRLEGFGKIKDEYISIVDYAPPGSLKLANYASKVMEKENVVLLKNHGVITAGKDLDEATLLAEFIEESAKIQLVSFILNL
ncbi:MAG: class II aldolase/adducin family protein [Methanobacteriaceae archaeon]|nr:class II aldolase/adducin family protein [Methanobacteriaceae archaeon]